jgi:hypothetical protein
MATTSWFVLCLNSKKVAKLSDPKPHDPMIYFTRENGKLGLCLSYLGKWIMTLLSGITLLLIAGAGNLWLTIADDAKQARVNSEKGTIQNAATLELLREYRASNDERVRRLEDRLERNDANDKKAHGNGGSK